MKHHYRMHIGISPLTDGEIEPALEVVSEQWSKPEKIRKIENGRYLFLEASAESYLCRGESEEEFAKRLSVAIWKKLGRYVKVTIDALYLEESPNDSYELSEFDYKRLLRTA